MKLLRLSRAPLASAGQGVSGASGGSGVRTRTPLDSGPEAERPRPWERHRGGEPGPELRRRLEKDGMEPLDHRRRRRGSDLGRPAPRGPGWGGWVWFWRGSAALSRGSPPPPFAPPLYRGGFTRASGNPTPPAPSARSPPAVQVQDPLARQRQPALDGSGLPSIKVL